MFRPHKFSYERKYRRLPKVFKSRAGQFQTCTLWQGLQVKMNDRFSSSFFNCTGTIYKASRGHVTMKSSDGELIKLTVLKFKEAVARGFIKLYQGMGYSDNMLFTKKTNTGESP